MDANESLDFEVLLALVGEIFLLRSAAFVSRHSDSELATCRDPIPDSAPGQIIQRNIDMRITVIYNTNYCVIRMQWTVPAWLI
jgi:hypothetical protein